MDPIADMLTQIRNAQAVGHKTVDLPFSKIRFEMANILNSEGYIGSVSKKGRGVKRDIEIVLKYKDNKNKRPFIQELKRVSKPGQRIYIGKKELGKFIKERGIIILSTSQGLMTIKEAKKRGVGGEILCRVW
ncbi:MAG: 30S ribosomal protein S8 [Patescibacteria group bacterium]